MKLSLYIRLAADNVRKNRRLYVPYLLSGCCMVMIFYVLSALTGDPAIRSMLGGGSLASMLNLGSIIMVLFSAVFLLYTSSFLMKQRNRELSLYNILGMSKRHVSFVLLFETLICAAVCIASGLLLGVLFSKAFQLTLLKLTGYPASADFTVAPSLLYSGAGIFLFIFLMIFVRGAFSVCRSRPIELLHSSQAGETPPRANALSALLGIVLLASGYAMAVSVRSALDAFTLFFVAVMLVILGTELCFRSASVYFLRLLKSNKDYYYKANHFISVSGMSYRMKRNGSSLATICILSTMVLVTLSAVTCLYVGTEDALLTQTPREIDIYTYCEETPEADLLSAPMEALLAGEGVTPQNVLCYRSCSFAGRAVDGQFVTNFKSSGGSITGVSAVTLIPLCDYNAMLGTDYTLAPGEALATGSLLHRLDGSITFFGEYTYRFTTTDIPMPPDASADFDITESLLLILPDADDLTTLNRLQAEAYGRNASDICATYAFDTGGLDAQSQIDLAYRLKQALHDAGVGDVYQKTRAATQDDYRNSNAGFLFLGCMLSLAFTCATALSMYYKQITEGYEDQESFAIMRKVGLSKRMIRKSVNSQILTVFFLPLITAGIHMAFAFPMLSKLLRLFGLMNTRLLALVTLSSFGAFSLLYIAVYLITSRTYYRIVTGAQQAA